MRDTYKYISHDHNKQNYSSISISFEKSLWQWRCNSPSLKFPKGVCVGLKVKRGEEVGGSNTKVKEQISFVVHNWLIQSSILIFFSIKFFGMVVMHSVRSYWDVISHNTHRFCRMSWQSKKSWRWAFGKLFGFNFPTQTIKRARHHALEKTDAGEKFQGNSHEGRDIPWLEVQLYSYFGEVRNFADLRDERQVGRICTNGKVGWILIQVNMWN